MNMRGGVWDPKLRQLSLQGTAGVHWEGGRGTRNLGRPKWTQKGDGAVGNYCLPPQSWGHRGQLLVLRRTGAGASAWEGVLFGQQDGSEQGFVVTGWQTCTRS